MSRRARIGVYAAAAVAAAILLTVLAAVLILPSHWFEDKVRARIVYEVERVSGGRAEIGNFHFDWNTLTARIAPFVLHGTEPAGQPPLIRADSIDVGLKVISLARRDVDIASLEVVRPRVNISVDERGNTNLPTPRVPRLASDPVQEMLILQIRKLAVRDGMIRFADRQIPVNIVGHDFASHLAYDFTGPRYAGTVHVERMRLESESAHPMEFTVDSRISLEPNRLGIETARLSMPESSLTISGEVTDFQSPRARMKVQAAGDVAELGGPLGVPGPHTGHVSFSGLVTYASATSFEIKGKTAARGLTFEQRGFRVRDVSFRSDVEATADSAKLSDVTMQLLGGTFTGSAALTDHFHNVSIDGRIAGISLRSAANAAGVARVPWNGAASGPVQLSGKLDPSVREMKAAGVVDVSAIAGQPPVRGRIDFGYDERTGVLRLGQSHLSTPGSDVAFEGVLGRQLTVKAETRDLNDLLPLLAMVSKDAPQRLPVRIDAAGSASFDGTITGPMKQPQISGSVRARNIDVRDQNVESVTAYVQASPSGIHATNFTATQGPAKVAGDLQVGLENWHVIDSGPVAGKLRVENGSIAMLLAQTGHELPLGGALTANIDLSGTVASPTANMRVSVANPTVHGERFDRFTADVRYGGTRLEVSNGVAQLDGGRVRVSGLYTHPKEAWNNGRLRFELRTSDLALARLPRAQELRPGVTGLLDVDAAGEADVRRGELFVNTVSATVSVEKVALANRPVGDLTASVKTTGQQMVLGVAGNMRGSKISGQGSFQLTGDYPGSGEVNFSTMPLSTAADLLRSVGVHGLDRLAAEGTIRGNLAFVGPARKPHQMKARLEFPQFELVPRAPVKTGAQQRDLTLRNAGPVIVAFDSAGLHVERARFLGADTDLSVAGTFNPQGKSESGLHVNGTVNLGAIQDFNPDVNATGVAVVAAELRGTLEDPQLNGKLELKKASFSIADFPNGLEDADGTILFDRDRATIQRLTGTSGGGKVGLSGFVGFGQGEVTYRLLSRAEGVRFRYPEGVSVSANAMMSLNGTSSRSLLSGTVTVLRVGFNLRTDIGGLLVASSTPIETPAAPDSTLRNVQLDVRVETIPNLTVQTAVTRDLQATADLRIRGTAAKPSVLGRVTINQGGIQFFGTDYTITRGEISFNNPVRIEPVVDLDLETRIRGIVVDINFAGPINKLNVSYRSDPPLQSSEIIALLAVGRTPGETTGIAASQLQNQTMVAGANTLLGQAASAPVQTRLQRFFGVSRLKIDPALQSLDAIPQARLTFEQQISKDVTLTYITNLSNTNQQIVRVQWDLDRSWSMVAIRDENGLFGIDFLFKRRFR